MAESINANCWVETIVDIPVGSELIKCKKCVVDGYEYRMFNYDPNYICNDDSKNGLYRSVIFSGLNDKLLCFTPPKSVTLDAFKNAKENTRETVTVSETVEGTMITLFYNGDIDNWEIATKGSVSGNYYYYRNEYFNSVKTQDSTFRNMFLDALQEPRSENKTDIDNSLFIHCLNKSYCYSFVLQHPDNHIVLPVVRPRVVLVSVFSITGNTVTYIPLSVYSKWDCFIDSVIDFPIVIDVTKNSGYSGSGIPYDIIADMYGSSQTSVLIVGANLVNNNTGMRTVIENPRYTELKELRGNNPNIQYQYLHLLRMDKVKDFLFHFPRYRSVFNRFKTQYTKFAQDVHNSYVQYFVFKNREVPISKRYMSHIFNLHKKYYVPSCIKKDNSEIDEHDAVINKKVVTKSVVFEYLRTLEPSVLLYYLNYDIHNGL